METPLDDIDSLKTFEVTIRLITRYIVDAKDETEALIAALNEIECEVSETALETETRPMEVDNGRDASFN